MEKDNVKMDHREDTFFAMTSRMKYIERWALMRNSIKENISEHSLEVAMIAFALANIGNIRLGKSYDSEHLAMIAMYHDCTEIITGDMPTPVKYENEDIKTEYKKIEHMAAIRMLNKLPGDLRNVYDEILYPKELDKGEAILIKAADKLSALIKCIEEEKNGNTEFASAKKSTESSIKKMDCKEAMIFMDEFLPAYYLTLDEL